MKLRIMSDLHLEFGGLDLAPAGEDVLVLAGDIDVGVAAAHQAEKLAVNCCVPAVEIAGNHEFYGGRQPRQSHVEVLAELAQIATASEGRVAFLENGVVERAGVRFIGATLWTDFALDDRPTQSMYFAAKGINDYNLIRRLPNERMTPDDTVRLHAISRDFIRDACAIPFAGPTVVMTHMAPSRRSVHPAYRDSTLNPAYASNLDELVEASGAVLWVHGHTHTSFDYRIGKTRVVCNPRGYVRYELNPDFNPHLLIEV